MNFSLFQLIQNMRQQNSFWFQSTQQYIIIAFLP